jgi:hypothetical protein
VLATGGSKRGARAGANSTKGPQKRRPATGQQHDDRPPQQPPSVAVEVPVPAAKRQKVQKPQQPQQPPASRSASPASSNAVQPVAGGTAPAAASRPLAVAVDKTAVERKHSEQLRSEPAPPASSNAVQPVAGGAAPAAAARPLAVAVDKTAEEGKHSEQLRLEPSVPASTQAQKAAAQTTSAAVGSGQPKVPASTGQPLASNNHVNGPPKQPVVTVAASRQGKASAKAPPRAPALAPLAKKARTQEAAAVGGGEAAVAAAAQQDVAYSKPGSSKQGAKDSAKARVAVPGPATAKHAKQQPAKVVHAAAAPLAMPGRTGGARASEPSPKGQPTLVPQQDVGSRANGHHDGLQRATSLPHALQTTRDGENLTAPVSVVYDVMPGVISSHQGGTQ